MSLKIKRIYDPAGEHDGARVLVERGWPRGVSKARAQLEDWLKDLAPSPALRAWWDHDPARMVAFTERYRAELHDGAHQAALARLREIIARHPTTTLLYAAQDPVVNHAHVLQNYLAAPRHAHH
ncbi:DUF488 family protein [Stenotrophomonas sp. HITSZ_GD]|uniref:DUF488 domain-containing protein n=1 Tax=Stenotrophomonas sp. HITSZ_GD TaxID=3037248 RepID=UPI00240D38DF|nr:DUF488 family protein [Stenotrophomonas sp. HITSZ_GD]MDG2526673.1 DUF488 family protein [Stenotrophomonas sp. HITSZ_GD]